MLDSREYEHDRNYRERKIGRHHPKHDCKISEQQPFHRRAYGPKARSPVLQKVPIGCEGPDGLDPVGIEIEAPETPCRDERERDKSDTDEDHERWKREEEGCSPPATGDIVVGHYAFLNL